MTAFSTNFVLKRPKKSFLRPQTTKICLRRRQPCDGNAERRTGHVRQADLVAELDGRGVAAVFAANAELDVGARLPAELRRHFDESAHARLVEPCERIAFVNLLFVVRGEEFARVVAAETERHLREVVGADVTAARGISIIVPTL